MIQKYRTRIYTNYIRFRVAAYPLTARQKVLVGIGTLTALALASFLAAMPALAQKLNEFELFVDCKPVHLVVEDIGAEGEDVVTGEAIRNAAEARLRSARMYDPLGPGILYINVNVGGPAYSLDFKFFKWVVDEYGNSGLGATWWVAATGTHGENGDFILSSVSRFMDEFIVEYFRANDFAC